MKQQIIEMTDSGYKSQLAKNSGIVLFYKKICPHCKALKKVIEKVATTNPTLFVMQIDSENNPIAMAEFEIERVPTLLITRNGQVSHRKSGILNVRELTALVQAI